MSFSTTTKLFTKAGCISSHIARFEAEVKQIDYCCIDIDENGKLASSVGVQRVPALCDRYVTVSDLDIVLEYLEEQNPAIPLLPANVADRAIYRSVVRSLHRDVFPLLDLAVTGDAAAVQKLRQQLHDFNATLEGRTYFAGDVISLIDITLAPWLYSAMSKGLSIKQLPHLSAYADRMIRMPAFAATVPTRVAA